MKSTARLRVGVLLILIVVALVSSLGALLWGNQEWDGLALNLGSEMAGAVVTYALLELFIGRREQREAEMKEREARRADLIAQLGSRVNDMAMAAAEELQRYGWLTDGSLRGVNLVLANLQGALLESAKLQEVDLSGANLQGANLRGANLQGASLRVANLQGTALLEANLQGANLEAARLRKAGLIGANLQGTFLRWANLQGAYLGVDTTLPDGTNWTPDTDIARFTDPDHPDFWRPDA